LRKVFLDNLPKKNKDNSKSIDWVKSIGSEVSFVYHELEGKIKIIDYERSKNKSILNIKYNNKEFKINTSGFLKCALGELLGLINKEYMYNIGDIIKDDKRNLKILDYIRIKRHDNNNTEKGYKYKCLIDGNISEIRETALKYGGGCNVCTNKKIIKGINDISTTNPELIKYFVDIEDTYKYTRSSGKYINMNCPDCGYAKNIKISDLYVNFSCPICGDGISYPNKFVRSFLNQLNEKYIPEFSSDWAFVKHNNSKLNGKKKYDNLLLNRDEIWEIHGLQHYEDKFNTYGKNAKSLKEEQENDKLKKELAEQNGLKYIIIDARYSDMEYIKNSLLNLSEFKRYDLSLINWNKCHEYAIDSLVKVACGYWNNGIKSTIKIGEIMKIGDQTIRKYLKQGAKLNWCDYSPEEARRISSKNSDKKRLRPIIQLSLDGKFVAEYKGAIEAERILNIKGLNRHIASCCRGKRNKAAEFRWMYKEDYELNKNNIKPYIKFNNQRRVVQLSKNNEFIKEWDAIKEIKETLKIYDISNCCKGKHKSADGFKWMYKEDYEEMLLTNTQ